jgi:enoyl-CoA hydratase
VAEVVLSKRVGRVLVIRLNRPEVRNAINRRLAENLAAELDVLDSDPDLSVGVLTGSGAAFCTGMDLKAFTAGERVEIQGRGLAGLTRGARSTPLVAAVEGYAVAGGFELALACDLVVAGQGCRFGLPEVQRGLIAGSGGLLRLAQRLPAAVAADLALSGRLVDAAYAERWGLVNEVVPDGTALDRALEIAEAICQGSPEALRATKTLLDTSVRLGEEAAWQLQDDLLARAFSSPDAAEGAAAFAEKRSPRWTTR